MTTMIRKARLQDMPEIVRLMRNFQKESPLPELRTIEDSTHFEKQVSHIIIGCGVCIVAEDTIAKRLVGMIIGIKSPFIWFPSHVTLSELAYWVEPNYRKTTIGYRLISAYINEGKELQKNKQITRFTMCKMTNSPDLKYDKLGFRYIEQTWVYEENK